MKKKHLLLSLFIIVLSGNARAQLTCTNCRVAGVDYAFPTTYTLLAAPASPTAEITFTGDATNNDIGVTLIGNATFNMLSEGIYTLNCIINERAPGGYNLTITALNATGGNIGGPAGNLAALVFAGNDHNTYGGSTIVDTKVTLMLNKGEGRFAVPHNLILNKWQSNLWCLKNYQFAHGYGCVVDMRWVPGYSANFNLYGTAQAIEGILAIGWGTTIQNYDLPAAPANLTEARTGQPTLSLRCELQNSEISNALVQSAAITKTGQDISSTVPKILIQKTGNYELIMNPLRTGNRWGHHGGGIKIKCIDGNLKFLPNTGVTETYGLEFELYPHQTDAFPSIEFRADVGADRLFGANYTLDGSSSSIGGFSDQGRKLYRKTGGGTLSSNVSVFKGDFKMNIEEGTFKNGGDYNNWSQSSIIMNVFPNAIFDIWGNHTTLGGLSGGGIVQNNWGSEMYNLRGVEAAVPDATTLSYLSPGYFYLTVGNNTAEANFSGVIKNNSEGYSVNAGSAIEGYETKFSRGGIALRKLGTGVQMLSGNNIYEGLTLIENGTLKLTGNGLLGYKPSVNGRSEYGSYEGDLIFGSVPVATTTTTPPSTTCTFEHNGNLKQEFRGSMRKTGNLPNTAIRYVQSGTGKTIITGNATNDPKEFPGVVLVTGGFFGGTGNIINAEKVEVTSGGSIGGGVGAANDGGTLTVYNLAFHNNAKVVVSNIYTTDDSNSPSVIDVRTRTGTEGSGTVTFATFGSNSASNAGYLIIDLLGPINAASPATIIKATIPANDITGLPTPIVGINTTTRTPCFQWTTNGLVLTFTSDTFLLPATGGQDLAKLCAGVEYLNSFTLSPPPNAGFRKFVFNAGSNVPVSGANETSLANGANGSNTVFTIRAGTYYEKKDQEVVFTIPISNNSGTCSTNRLPITIHPNPRIEDNAGDNITLSSTTPLCGGTRYPRAIKVLGVSSAEGGEWKFFKEDGTTEDNSGSVSESDVQAGIVAGHLTPGRITNPTAIAQVAYSVGGACRSNLLLFSIKRSPDFTFNDITILGGQPLPAFGPSTNGGAGKDRADYFKWVKKSGDAQVGPGDYTTAWDKTVINGFTAPDPALIPTSLVANYEVTGINGDGTGSGLFSGTGCSSTANFNITELKNCPTLTLTAGAATDINKLCGGVTYNDAVALTIFPTPASSLCGTWKIYTTDTGTMEAVSEAVAGSPGKGTIKAQANDGIAALTQQVAYSFPGCSSNRLPITIYPKPVALLPDVVNLCSDQPAVIPLTTGGGLRAATGYKWNQSGAHNDPVNLYDQVDTWATGIPSFTPPVPTTPGILTRSMVISAYNSTTLCTGDEKNWTIRVSTTPVIARNGTIDLARLCAGVVYDGAVSVSPSAMGGSWAVYQGGTTPEVAGTISTEVLPSSTSGLANIRAGNNAVSSTPEDLVFTSTSACRSNKLPIIINPAPWMGNEATLAMREFCHGERVPEWAPSGGAGMTKPNAFQWQVVTGTNSSAIGLNDYSADWTKSKISGFTATNSTFNPIGRDLMVTGRNDGTGCTVAKRMRLNVRPTPVIEAAASTDLAKLCAGSLYPNAITISSGGTTSGLWSVYREGTPPRVSSIQSKVEIGGGNDQGNLRAGNASRVTTEGVVYKSSNNCFSNTLSITIYPKPVMNDIPAMAYCTGSSVPAFTPVSAGEGEARPSAWQWRLAANAVNTADIGLADYFSDWDENAISGFTAATINGMLKRDLTITGRNSTSGCETDPKAVTLTINSALTLTPESLSPICSGTKTHILLSSSLANTTYTWTVNSNNVGARAQNSATEDTAIKQELTNSANSTESVTYSVTGQAGSCIGQADVAIAVSHSPGVTASVSGGGAYCVGTQDNKYQTNLIPGVPGATNVEWTYTSDFPLGQADIVRGATRQTVKGTLAAVRDNLTLTGNGPALVYYVFRVFSGGCFGAATAPIEVSIHPVPVAEVVASPAVCSNSRTNIQLTGLTTHVVYTWRVDETIPTGVSGYTAPSLEGAIVSSKNPTAAKGSPVNERLWLPDNSGNQTRIVVYWITPWSRGCAGQAREARVQVNPLPVLTMPAGRQHCTGVSVPAEILTGSNGANEFKWTGGTSAGLADQTVYGTGLPDYRAATTAQSITARVFISARNANGCESLQSPFTIKVSPKPVIVIPPDGSSLALCAGTAIEKAATAKIEIRPAPAGAAYKWSASFMDKRVGGNSSVKMVNNGIAGDFPVEENTPQTGDLIRQIIATHDSNGTITFSVTPELSGCRGEVVSTAIDVRGINLHEGIVNNSAAGICSGSAANIKVGEAGDGNVYSWTIEDKAANVQGYQPQLPGAATTISDVLTLNNTKRGNITYSIAASNTGCAATTLPYTIFVNPVPVITGLPATASICSGSPTNINLPVNLTEPEISGVAYTWTVSENTMGAQSSGSIPTGFVQQTLTNPNVVDSRVTYTFTPWYIPGDGGGNCGGSPAAVVYSVSTPPVAGISNIPEKVCLGDKITLNATPEGLNYQWLKGGVLISDATGRSYQVPTDTEATSSYSVTVTNSCGSHTSAAKEVSVSAEAYFVDGKAETDKANKSAGMDEVVNFSYNGNGTEVDYQWDFGDHTYLPDVSTTAHIYYKPGTWQPTLKVVKKGQPSCTKTFQVGPLEITGTAIPPYTNDPTVSAGLSVFPIPAHDQLTIVNDNDMYYILISDISGKTVWSEATNGHKALLPIDSFANGIYLLTIMDSKGVKRKKISKN